MFAVFKSFRFYKYVTNIASTLTHTSRLSNTYKNISDFESSIEELRKHEFSNKRVHIKQLLKTLENLDDPKEVLVSQCDNPESSSNVNDRSYLLKNNNDLFLLKCCAMLPDTKKEIRLDILERIWNIILIEKNDQPTKEQIWQYLDSCKETNKIINDIMKFTKKYNCIKDQKIYESIFHLNCLNGMFPQKDDINLLINELYSEGFTLNANIFNSILLYFGQQNKLHKLQEILDTMKAANVQPTIETHFELLRAYLSNKNNSSAFKILNMHGEKFSVQQLGNIIRLSVLNDNLKCLEMAIAYLPYEIKTNKIVAPLIRNICIDLIYSNEPLKAFKIIEYLPAPNYNQNDDIDIYCTFFINEMLKCQQHFKYAEVKNFNNIIIDICYKLISSKRNIRALHVLCEISLKINCIEMSLEYLKELSKNDNLRIQYFWPLLIQTYLINGEVGVLKSISEINKLNVPIDFMTISQYILPKLPLTLKDPSKAIAILNDNGINVTQSLTPILVFLLNETEYNTCTSIINKYKKTKINTEQLVWPLMMACRSTDNYGIIAKLIAQVQTRSNVKYYDLTGTLLQEFIIRVNEVTSVIKLLDEFEKCNLKISEFAFNNLHNEFMKSKELREHALQRLNTMVDSNLTFARSATTNDAIPVLQMKDTERDALPSTTSEFNRMYHPRQMSLNELECHLIELQSKQMNARGVLRRILQLCVREGKLDRAQEVYDMCVNENVDVSPGMLASVFDLMVRTKNLEKAESTFKQLLKTYPKFTIDEHKIIDYTTLMLEMGRTLKSAENVLRNFAKLNKIVGGENLQKNLWNLLSTIAQLNASNNLQENGTKIFLQFLVELGFCDYQQNTLLGPIIREHLLKNNIQDAVTEFCELATLYRKTPLYFELLSKLIEILNQMNDTDAVTYTKELSKYNFSETDKDKIQRMIEAVQSHASKIHGKVNANLTFILAVANCGNEKQLRKMLIDPATHINAELLIKHCEYLSNTGAFNTLIKLARCSRGLGTAINENEIYTILLSNYIRKNNYVDAINLFEEIHMDNEFKISKEFANKLCDLLLKNKLEVPTNVALLARRN